MVELFNFPIEQNAERAHVEKMVRKVLDAHGGAFAGFAFMVWDKDGLSTCEAQNNDSCIPSIVIPDFVRNRLLAQRIESWAVDTIKND